MATKEELGIIVKLTDLASGPAGKIGGALGSLGHAAGNVEKSFGKLRGASQRLNAVLQGIGIGVGIGSFYALERAIGSVIRIIPDLIGKGEQWAKTVDDIADKTGVTAEQASKLAAAAQYVNVSTDSLTLGLVRLSRYVIDNEQRFTKFGIATRDANGNLLDAYTIFQNVRNAISGTGAAMLSTAAAQDLLGRGGADLADMLQLTDAQFNAISADAQRSGLIMTDAARTAAENWERTKTRLSSTITGLGTEILGGVAPYLSQLVDSISNAIQQNMDNIVRFAVQVVNFLGGLVAGLFGLTLPTVTFANALGNVGTGANAAADGLSNLTNQTGPAAAGEDRLTASLNRQIAAIDRQLKLMGRRDSAQNAAEQRQKILDDLATAQQELADVQNETIFAAGMTNAELVLAQQKQADDIIAAQKNVSDTQQQLADHDRQEQQRIRRQQLEDERAALQKRLAAHRQFVAQLKQIYKPIMQPTGPSLAAQGKTISSFSTFGTPAGGLTAAITQAAADARLAGQQMAQNVKDFADKVSNFVTWAQQLIPALIALKVAQTGAGLLGGGGGGGLLGALGLSGFASGAAPAAGTVALISAAAVGLVAALGGIDHLIQKAQGKTDAEINASDTRSQAAAAQQFALKHGANFTATPGTPDSKDRYLQSIARSLMPGGSFFQQHGDAVSAAQDSASNTADTAFATSDTNDRISRGIDTNIKNTPTVNSATGFRVDATVTVPSGQSLPISGSVAAAVSNSGTVFRTTLGGNEVPVLPISGSITGNVAAAVSNSSSVFRTTLGGNEVPVLPVNGSVNAAVSNSASTFRMTLGGNEVPVLPIAGNVAVPTGVGAWVTNTQGDGGLIDRLSNSGPLAKKLGNVTDNTSALTGLSYNNGYLAVATAKKDIGNPGKPPPPCFIAGTMVDTPAGAKAIEDFRVGDTIMAVDISDMSIVESVVTATRITPDHHVPRIRVVLVDGREITATERHPFYNPVRGDFYPIGTFEVGHLVHDAELGAVEIASMTWLREPTTVYNLTVETYQNYLVDGILVHNVSDGAGAATGLLGMSNMATDVTFGEAGREAVAILRNPRRGSAAELGGGSGGSMNITLVLPGVGPIARGVLDWADRNASRSTTLRMVPGGSN